MNHPAGRIGKRLILRVADVMLTGSSLPLASPDALIMEVRPGGLGLLGFRVRALLVPREFAHAHLLIHLRTT
jgi:hypothetical protein